MLPCCLPLPVLPRKDSHKPTAPPTGPLPSRPSLPLLYSRGALENLFIHGQNNATGNISRDTHTLMKPMHHKAFHYHAILDILQDLYDNGTPELRSLSG
ncbi:hypothetical protein E2C01_033580 [Portunus trituberculatus]|uniref:Uncharacterized protein n=1 Tax=Portunus trituberculatus TaxID=210409 RepID=A0A5B7F2U1_PORTR|nr:hypothetical protein [Portunus trituberculatus]